MKKTIFFSLTIILFTLSYCTPTSSKTKKQLENRVGEEKIKIQTEKPSVEGFMEESRQKYEREIDIDEISSTSRNEDDEEKKKSWKLPQITLEEDNNSYDDSIGILEDASDRERESKEKEDDDIFEDASDYWSDENDQQQKIHRDTTNYLISNEEEREYEEKEKEEEEDDDDDNDDIFEDALDIENVLEEIILSKERKINDDNDEGNYDENSDERSDDEERYRSISITQAALDNDIDEVRRVVERDPYIRIDRQNSNGKRAIFYAIQNNNVEMVDLLISYGSNVNTLDNRGNSLLTAAIQTGNPVIVEMLLNRMSKKIVRRGNILDLVDQKLNTRKQTRRENYLKIKKMIEKKLDKI